ncbi:hypothetical protein AZE42_07287 [Rhizopogon vesiculosus]|uniref:Uncharacterized protein n=1 Tax=Rhizopogon vesiculosus TaxID=180088 RepID=A0A1J8PLU5_9AGAM|nr:hypothetical protein AZE42_07287 [Rhizopogon vesiculosus]
MPSTATIPKAVFWIFLVIGQVLTAQVPLTLPPASASGDRCDLSGQWNLDEQPATNVTGNLVFETANSLLQHWANTRYRNGHTIVPGTIPVGTILYHGAIMGPHIPTALDWVATEPDHSMLFCMGEVKSGCLHVTFVVTRPMKVLYFDGSSAALFSEGSMDTQDLLAWSEMKPEWALNEYQRIEDLCKWGQKYGLNGFVRMQMNFEMMICNFTSHMEVVSSLNLETLHLKLDNGQPTEDLNTMHSTFELMNSASWREAYPGETQVILDYSGLVSFYDTALVPSLAPRRVGLERWDHRVAGISSEDMERVKDRLAQLIDTPAVWM